MKQSQRSEGKEEDKRDGTAPRKGKRTFVLSLIKKKGGSSTKGRRGRGAGEKGVGMFPEGKGKQDLI